MSLHSLFMSKIYKHSNMNKYKFVASLALGATLLVGCKQDDLELAEHHEEQAVVSSELANSVTPMTVVDVIRVRFDNATAERIETAIASNAMRSAGTKTDELLSLLGAESLERVFPYAGEYEARTRRAGLHLWYDIKLTPESDPQRALEKRAKAMELASEYSGVQVTELVYQGALPDIKPVVYSPNEASLRSGASTGFPTDDPMLPLQWHYHNTGENVRSVAGADINLFPAWEIERGKPNVIVAVVDGGIDITHEDLRESMHVNLAELNGTANKDDDNNGLVDDIYGYNFAMGQPALVPHDHGTHVAGTVAARNNNAIGVSGVAGGDGSANSGIRMISCQTFATNASGQSVSGGFERAIKYGADAGAVISQNSWGQPHQTQLPESYKAAIDYFIQNAGCDKDGKQRADSPMKGGVVIFASGNEGYEYRAAIASYDAVIAVASMAPDFHASYFTTFGTWVDITGPGGDMFYNNGKVLSTLPGNKYGYMQGTSMACPHVSGIAALVVSKYGGQGFTNEDLKRRLLTSLKAQSINDINPKYQGKLGAGYIDAALALAAEPSAAEIASNKAPESVRWAASQVTHGGVTISWNVATDPEEGKAFGYYLYGEARPITEQDLPTLGFSRIVETGAKPGELISRTYNGLAANTEYYFAIVPYDKWGHKGKPSFTTVRTLSNNAPTITKPEVAPIRLSGDEVYELRLPVGDADGHSWTWRFVGPNHGATVTQQTDALLLQLRVRATVGKYTVTLEVRDELGATAEVTIPFEIYHNNAPVVSRQLDRRIYVTMGEQTTLSLANYFSDVDGEPLSYAVRQIGTGVATATLSGSGNSLLAIDGVELGVSAFELSATDPKGLTVKAVVEIEVLKDDLVQLLYPSPTTTTLNMRVKPKVAALDVVVYNATGTQILRRKLEVQANSVASLDVSALPSGSYVLQASAAGKTVRKPFVKR